MDRRGAIATMRRLVPGDVLTPASRAPIAGWLVAAFLSAPMQDERRSAVLADVTRILTAPA